MCGGNVVLQAQEEKAKDKVEQKRRLEEAKVYARVCTLGVQEV